MNLIIRRIQICVAYVFKIKFLSHVIFLFFFFWTNDISGYILLLFGGKKIYANSLIRMKCKSKIPVDWDLYVKSIKKYRVVSASRAGISWSEILNPLQIRWSPFSTLLFLHITAQRATCFKINGLDRHNVVLLERA